MHEYIARPFYYLEIHLLYASLVWLVAWILTSMRSGSATTKYWIWVATSLNFILPLGAVFDKVWASHLRWATPLGVIGAVGVIISENLAMTAVLGVVWLFGAILMITRLCLRIRAERHELQASVVQSARQPRPGFFVHGMPVRFGARRQGPAVDGVLRPHISLPEDIEQWLTKSELDAVLLHELTHARRRDNLIRLIHELGLCVLWFHPLVWFTGSRLALYRELSCDELVIQNAHGGDLVSALAKLANPERGFLLQATASSLISHRLARLTAAQPRRRYFAANALLIVMFVAGILEGVFGTVAHTACCFRR